MRVRIERRKTVVPPQELVEVVTPRTNAATISAAENLFAAIALPEPFSLEIAATSRSRWFLGRAQGPAMRQHLESQLGVAYPQAELRRVEHERYPALDPAALGPTEQVEACALTLRAPPYLPLRTFRDVEVEAGRAAQADPALGVLGALGDLPLGWRGLAQLVLRPAPEDWCRAYLRLAVEHPLTRERLAGQADTSLTSVFALAGLLGLGVLEYQAHEWYSSGDWLELGLLGVGTSVGLPGLVWLLAKLNRRAVYDPRLVQEKVSRIAYLAQLRLAVFAPREAPAGEVRTRLDRLAAAYRQFSLASGNALVPRRLRLAGRDLRDLAPLSGAGRGSILNTRELAGLWHLPQAQADVPLLERTTARRFLPLPFGVERGCRIGVSSHQGRTVSVCLSDDVLRRHTLLVAKTRRGKSSLLLTIARYLMEARDGARPPMLFLVDPHRDLAASALALVPASRRTDVVYLDLADESRPFGLNLIDAGLGWGRDKAVSNALLVFRREFDRFWGPRMEDAFRFALLTLYEVNQAVCSADARGRTRQHTVLDVPAVLVDASFRRSLLGMVADPTVKAWWSGYFERLDRRLQIEVVNPVQTKIQRFAGSRAARAIVGQPRSTINPAAWLREGAIVIVNTAKGVVGEDTSALVGGTLINLVALVVGEQARLEHRERRPARLLVDEFQTMSGADYEAILSELAKYGASLTLATQSLARIDALDRESRRSLRAMVFANVDTLFTFQTSAEDARYLVRELGGGLDEADLVELPDYYCYARLSVSGERLATFSVELDPPPEGDLGVREELARASALRYGRDVAAVESDLRSALARVELTHPPAVTGKGERPEQSGVARDQRPEGEPASHREPRNQHRKPKKPRERSAPHQLSLLGEADEDGDAGPATPGLASAELGGPDEERRG